MTTGLGKKLTADVETAGAQAGTVGGAAVSKGVVKETEGLGSKLKGQFASFGPLLGIALGGALLKGSLDAFDTLEKSTKRLQIGFDAIHQPQALDGLTKWASDFADQTGILQADVEDFSGKLLNMGSGFFQKAGPEGLRLLEDMTKALEGMSAETGKSATMLMRSLGPAILNTPDKALPLLQKYGALTVQQTADVKKLTDAGKDQAATQLIINDLTGKYGDAAARSATPMDKLKEQWNKLEITLGGIVAQILPPLVSLLHDLEPVLKVAGDHAGILLTAFLGFKAIQFLPILLQGVGLAAARLNLNGIASTATTASQGLSNLSKTGALLASGAFAVGIPLITEAIQAFGSEAKSAEERAQAFLDMLTSGKSAAQIRAGFMAVIPDLVAQSGGLITKEDALRQMNDALAEAHRRLGLQQKVQGAEAAAAGDSTGKATAKVLAAQAAAQAHADAVQNQAIELAKVQPLLKSTTSFFGQQITTLADLKSSWNDWRTQTAGALDFVGGSFDTLATKSGESVSKLQAGLDKSLASMKVFGANLHTIAQDGGRGAQELVQHLLALGPAGATMAQKLVDAGREGRRGIEGDLGGALKVAKTESQQLEKALVGGFNKIARAIIIATTPVDKLAAKLAAFDGKTYTATVGVDTSQANAALAAFVNQWNAAHINLTMNTDTSLHGRAGGGPIEPLTSYIVGEHGPELFMSDRAGRIEPHVPAARDQWRPGRDAGQIVVRNTLKVDRRHFLDGQDYELRFGGPG